MKTDMKKITFTDETRSTLDRPDRGGNVWLKTVKSVVIVSGANRAGVA